MVEEQYTYCKVDLSISTLQYRGLQRILVHLTGRVYFKSTSYREQTVLVTSQVTVQRIDLKKFRDLFRQFRGKFAESSRKVRGKFEESSRKVRGKFAESPRASRDREEEKNARLADSRAMERNWSFPTAPGYGNFPGYGKYPGYRRPGIKTCRNSSRNPGYGIFPG